MFEKQVSQQLVIPFKETLRNLGLSDELYEVLTKSGLLLNLAERIADKKALEVVWPEIHLDSACFSTVFKFLKDISKKPIVNDEIFAKHDIHACKVLLSETQLFRALTSDKIILTKAHRIENTNSQEHVLTVLKNILTDSLSDNEKFIMRVHALMHDNGKMLMAGYEGDSEELMKTIGNVDKEGNASDSYVDHQLLSAMIFDSIINHSEFAKKQFSDESEIKYVRDLIAHHHLFAKLNRYLKNDSFDLNGYFANAPEVNENKRWEYLLHSFLFNLADISATKGHWPYLFANIDSFDKLVEIYAKQENRDEALLEKMKQSIELAKTKYQFCNQEVG